MAKPVVVYGASGYTGRLICEYLREYNLPFVAAGRSAARVQEAMDKLPGVETAMPTAPADGDRLVALAEKWNIAGPCRRLVDAIST